MIQPIDLKRDNNFQLCLDLNKFSKETYDLSALICTEMSGNYDNVSLFATMTRCRPLSECDPCSDIGYKIAKSLIKISALRIFAEPEQSIIEIIVNSLDAYNPNKKIGKFGMGFFSILYWIVGHPNRRLIIESYSIDIDGNYCAYQLMIQEISDKLTFRIITKPSEIRKETGTIVWIDASQDPFTKENLEGFSKQIEKLKYILGQSLIKSNFRIREKITTPIPNSHPSINYISDQNRLIVEDFATGIPLEVVLGVLLIPSISTKTIQLAKTDKDFINGSRLNITPNGNSANFIILVGGVGVVDITIITNTNHSTQEYILDMPLYTRLPVSRDDIILTPITEDIMKRGIKILFDDAMKLLGDVSLFQKLLTKYSDYTAATTNKNVIQDSLTQYYDDHVDELVPYKYITLYKRLSQNYNLKTKFIGSNQWDVWHIESTIERNLDNKGNDKIWYGITVINLDWDSDISSGGLVRYLFVNPHYIARLGNRWIETITTSYLITQLYPYNLPYGQEYQQYLDIHIWILGMELPSQYISFKGKQSVQPRDIVTDDDTLQKIVAVANRFDKAVQIYFERYTRSIGNYIISELCIIYMFLNDKNILNHILVAMLTKLGTFKGNQTYATESNKIHIGSYSTIEFNSEITRYDKLTTQKYQEFLKEHILYVIQSIEERSTTRLSFITILSPRQLVGSLASVRWFDTIPLYELFGNLVAKYSRNLLEYTLLYAIITPPTKKKSKYESFSQNLESFILFVLKDFRKQGQNKLLLELYQIENEGSTRHIDMLIHRWRENRIIDYYITLADNWLLSLGKPIDVPIQRGYQKEINGDLSIDQSDQIFI